MSQSVCVVVMPGVLNEVLSLNAQESVSRFKWINLPPFLNEVLSLNAQECAPRGCGRPRFHLLNEVLSLNAQEYRLPRRRYAPHRCFLNEVLSLNAQECLSRMKWHKPMKNPQ